MRELGKPHTPQVLQERKYTVFEKARGLFKHASLDERMI